MTALQLAQNKNFQLIALEQAFKTLSSDTGISVKSLVEQFSQGNQKLITKVGEMVATAAQVTADSLNAK